MLGFRGIRSPAKRKRVINRAAELYHNGVKRRSITDDQMIDELTQALNGYRVPCVGECRHLIRPWPGNGPCPNGYSISARAMGVLLA